VTKIPRDLFLKFENTGIPYPYPLQRQAWFGILFRDSEGKREPSIWFLRFPLDEQGRLLQAARDDFLHRLLENLGQNLQALKDGEKLDSALQENPYSFKPKEERMALFHAKAELTLKQPASKYYDHARRYFSGELGWEQWPFIGYQGIADLAVRLDDEGNSSLIAEAIPRLPARPYEALCQCLENLEIPLAISQALLARVTEELEAEAPEPALVAAGVRGIACSRSPNLRKELIRSVLGHPISSNPEILAAISGRTWEDLREPKTVCLFLQRLAENSDGQAFFDQCLTDLLFIPGMREPLLAGVRNPERSEQLGRAIGKLFQGIST
jgi:hypothetical protein